MHLTRYAVLLLLIGCSVITARSQNNKDQFVKKIFQVLQTRDKESFLKLFPDLATYKKIAIDIGSKAKENSGEAEFAKEVNSWTQKDYNEKLDPMKEEFDNIIQKGEKRGVDWATAQMTKWDEFDGGEEAAIAKAGYKMLAGKISFTSKGKDFIIRFEQALWYQPDNKWYGVELDRPYEKGKEAEADEEDMKELELMMGDNSADTMAVAVDTLAKPVPPQQKTDTPNKSVPKKTTRPSTTKPPVRKDN
jgi:hypothetical protein